MNEVNGSQPSQKELLTLPQLSLLSPNRNRKTMLITGGMLHLNIKLDRKSGLIYATYARNVLAKNWEVGRLNLLC